MLKHKEEVFRKFIEWKAMEEKSSGKRLRTDYGGAYPSKQFKDFLKKGRYTL